MRNSFMAALVLAAAAPALAQATPPAGWTCDPAYYGDEGCDCGCGVADSDCADAALTTCQYNGCTEENTVPTAANTLVCAANICGDSIIAGEEVCDDGDGPGCSADCATITEGYSCGLTFLGIPLEPFGGCHLIVCGDAKVEGTEECEDDDGATPAAGDGCSATCTLEAGYACPTAGEACHPVVCGDGTVEGDEECEDDDGASPQSGDGCSATCTQEDGYSCNAPGEACVAIPADWACAASYYGGDDGCDCGCGAIDPDCSPGCAEPGCAEPSCQYCYDEAGTMVETCPGAGEGEGEGEDPPVGEGEGEGEGDGGRDDEPNRDPPACSASDVTTGAPPALAVLFGLVLLMSRRRR